MKTLEFIHWKLALSFAFKLFFTPLKFPINKREIPIREKAKRHERIAKGNGFTCFEWGDRGPKVILMHGWSGRATQFYKIIEALVTEGFHVFSIEGPAHGESKQKQTSLLEFVDAIELIIEEFGPMEIAIGHSLGGMAVFNAFERKHLQLKKAIIIGTPANIRNVVNDFVETVGAGPRVAQGIIDKVEKGFEVNIEHVSTDYLAHKHNPPGLIFHDKQDADAAVINARTVAKAWSNAELIITDGLGHRRILIDEGVISRIIDFLKAG